MKANKELLYSEYSKVWSDERMRNYCTNKVATMAILPDGSIITVEKQGIEKNFCFGESGHDYDDAAAAAHHAMTSEDYLFRQNMEGFNRTIKALEESKENGLWLHIMDISYTGQAAGCRIRSIQYAKASEVLEEVGPSFLNELYGQRVKIRGCEGHLATLEEIEAILTAYKEAAADHEKKVRSYIKRYGTSKVNAWTYWRDA